MDADALLKQVTIPEPCPADWDAMPGGDRARSCSACGQEVHDFEALTADEAASLLVETGGHLCGRVARDEEGRVVTSEAPATPGGRGRVRFRLRSLMILIAGVAAAFGLERFIERLIASGELKVPGRSTVTVGRICLPPPAALREPPARRTSSSMRNNIRPAEHRDIMGGVASATPPIG